MDGLSSFGASAIVVIFTLSSLSKLRDPAAFRAALASYGWIPRSTFESLAVGVPAVEVALVAGLVIPASRPIAALAATVVLVVFSIALTRAVLGGKDADCGCFNSRRREPVSWFSILRNVLLVVLAVATALAGSPEGFIVAPAALAGAGVALVVVVVDQAVASLRQPRARSAG